MKKAVSMRLIALALTAAGLATAAGVSGAGGVND